MCLQVGSCQLGCLILLWVISHPPGGWLACCHAGLRVTSIARANRPQKAIFKSLLVSCVLMSCCSKQTQWLSRKSGWVGATTGMDSGICSSHFLHTPCYFFLSYLFGKRNVSLPFKVNNLAFLPIPSFPSCLCHP